MTYIVPCLGKKTLPDEFSPYQPRIVVFGRYFFEILYFSLFVL